MQYPSSPHPPASFAPPPPPAHACFKKLAELAQPGCALRATLATGLPDREKTSFTVWARGGGRFLSPPTAASAYLIPDWPQATGITSDQSRVSVFAYFFGGS